MLKRVLSFLCCLALFFAVLKINYVSGASGTNESGELSVEGQGTASLTDLNQTEVLAFLSEEAIQHYAYLDLDTAGDTVKPLILAARNKIIYQHSWVADEAYGEILDPDGNVKEVLPHFSDLFPLDWDVPIESQELDLSYYR